MPSQQQSVHTPHVTEPGATRDIEMELRRSTRDHRLEDYDK